MDRPRALPNERAIADRRPGAARTDGELLLAALRAGREPDAAAAIRQFDNHEWLTVIRHAAWHRVMPLLYHRLAAQRAVVPHDSLERLHQAYLAAAGENLRLFGQIAELLAALDAADVPVIALKGAGLAEEVYRNIALRGMRDIDILVRTHDLEYVTELMHRLGYEQSEPADIASVRSTFHHLPRFTRPHSVGVEVHWTLELPTSPFRIDLDRVWNRSRRTRIAGQEARVLAPEDLLLHLCLHASYHHHFRVRLRHLTDIAATVERYESALRWSVLVNRASEWGAERFVYTTMSLAAELLGAPIPADVLTAFDHDAEDEEVVRIAGDFVLAAPVELPIAYRTARASHGIGAKAAVYLDSLFPPPGRLRELYGVKEGSWTLPLYYFVRPVDVARRFGRVLAQLGRQSDRLPLSLEREHNGVLIDGWIAGKEERCR
ncbi:MAG TPA: nucleotidyltransferase family protein [Gemmatimonadaceae bacterium]|nr:nucleotidyltransferase family protein [Gemmatimonadaceae bacterium]